MKRLQLDQPGQEWPLHWLELASVIDKHRRPAIAGASLAGISMRGLTGYEPLSWEVGPEPLVQGAEIGRVVFPRPASHVDVDPDFGYDIVFFENEMKFLGVHSVLDDILGCLRNRVLPGLLPYIT